MEGRRYLGVFYAPFSFLVALFLSTGVAEVLVGIRSAGGEKMALGKYLIYTSGYGHSFLIIYKDQL